MGEPLLFLSLTPSSIHQDPYRLFALYYSSKGLILLPALIYNLNTNNITSLGVSQLNIREVRGGVFNVLLVFGSTASSTHPELPQPFKPLNPISPAHNLPHHWPWNLTTADPEYLVGRPLGWQQ